MTSWGRAWSVQWAAAPEAQPGASGGHHLLGTARRMIRYEAVQELRSTLGGIDQSVFSCDVLVCELWSWCVNLSVWM